MADTEHPRGQMVFQSRLTSPKSDEQVGASETYNNGPVLAFKVYPKGWDDGDHVSSREVRSPQADNDIDDDLAESERLGESIDLPPMLSPPPRYVPSQVHVFVCDVTFVWWYCIFEEALYRALLYLRLDACNVNKCVPTLCIPILTNGIRCSLDRSYRDIVNSSGYHIAQNSIPQSLLTSWYIKVSRMYKLALQ